MCMCMCLLVSCIKFLKRLRWRLGEILRLLQLNLFEWLHFDDLFENGNPIPGSPIHSCYLFTRCCYGFCSGSTKKDLVWTANKHDRRSGIATMRCDAIKADIVATRPDYFFDAGNLVDPADLLLREFVDDCSTWFGTVASPPNEYGYTVYRLNVDAVDLGCSQ